MFHHHHLHLSINKLQHLNTIQFNTIQPRPLIERSINQPPPLHPSCKAMSQHAVLLVTPKKLLVKIHLAHFVSYSTDRPYCFDLEPALHSRENWKTRLCNIPVYVVTSTWWFCTTPVLALRSHVVAS